MGMLPLAWLSDRGEEPAAETVRLQLPDALECSPALAASRAEPGLRVQHGRQRNELHPSAGSSAGIFEEQNLGILEWKDSLDAADRANSQPRPEVLRHGRGSTTHRRAAIWPKSSTRSVHLIRERFQIWGQIQALTGEGRLSGVVLLALPVVLFLVVYRLNPDLYVKVLFTDPMGKKMLAGAVVMQFSGPW